MEEGSGPPHTSSPPQKDKSHLEDQMKTMITGELVNRPTTERDFEKLRDDQRAQVLLMIAMSSEASEELRLYSLDRLFALLTGVIRMWSSEKLVPFSDELIKSLLSETNDSITEKMGDILVAVTVQSLYLNSNVQAYRSISDFVRNCARNGSNSLKKVGLAIVKRVPNLFGVDRVSDLKDVFERALSDVDSAIRFAAAQIFFSVVHKDTIAALSPLLSYIIKICEEFLSEFVTGDISTSPPFCPFESLSKLASEYTNSVRPHLTAIIHLCDKVWIETRIEHVERLTAILALLLKGRNNEDFHTGSCAIIVHFIFHFAPSTTTEMKLSAFTVMNAIPRAFGDAARAVKLIARRLNDEDTTVRSQAVYTLVQLLNAHDGEYRLILIGQLLPDILEKCKVQVASDEEFHSTHCSPIDCIWEISRLDPKLLLSEYFAVVALSTNIVGKTNTDDNEHVQSMELQRSKAFDIQSRLFGNSMSKYPNTDSETEIIAQMFQQLTKLAYSEFARQPIEEIIELVESITKYLEEVDEIANSWSVVRSEMKKISPSDYSLTVTLHFIQAVDVFGSSPTDVSFFFSFSFSHTFDSIRSLALKAFIAHFRRMGYGGRLTDSMQQLNHLFPRLLMFAKDGSAEERYLASDYLFSLSYKFNVILQARITELANFYCQLLTEESVNRSHDYARDSITLLCNMPEIASDIVPLIPLILSSSLHKMSRLNESMSNWEGRDQFMEGVEHYRGTLENFNDLVWALKSRGVEQELLHLTNQMLNHVDWNQRHVGVIGLSAISRVATEETVPVVLKRIISLLQDSDNRVRSAACSTLIRLFTECAPNLLEKSHSIVIPALLTILEDTRVPRLTAAAAAALATCCKIYHKPDIRAHLSALMYAAIGVVESTYRSLLTDGKTIILAQPIKLISSMQDIASSYYGVYYSNLSGPLKTILTSLSHNLRICPILYSASLECLSLIAIAIGEKKCSADCTEIMHSVSTRFGSILLFPDLSSNLGRMASAMGNSFLPFLPSIMPLMIDSIGSSSFNYNENDELEYNDEHGGIIRKIASCAITTSLAKAIGAGFLPYASELSMLALAHFTTPIFTIVRNGVSWTVKIIPALLHCFKAGQDELSMDKLWMEYWLSIRDELKDGGGKPFIKSITDCIQIIGRVSKEESLVIKESMENEKESLRSLRQQLEMERLARPDDAIGLYFDEIEYRRGREKEYKELAESIQALEYNMMRFSW